MNALTTWLSHGVAERLGWTLLHSLWQATLVAAVLAIVLRFLAKSSAQLRYAIACAAMIAMALLPAATSGLLSLPSGKATMPAAPREQVQQLPAAARVETLRVSMPPIQAQTPSEPAYERPWRDVAVERLESALPYAVSVWLAGVLLFSVRHLLAWTRLRQLRHRQVRPADANLCDGLSTMTKRLGIQRAVRLVESGLVQVPTVIGWLRPMILLPACAATGLPADQLEALLLHELAHVRRYDYLVNLAQAVLETLGFYHPAVWWVSNRIRVERENCCDDVAARALGDNLRYAKALASMEDLRADQPGLAMAASGGSLLARIRRLVGRSPNEGSSSTWAPVLVVGLLLLVAAIPVGLAIAEDYTGPTNDLERAVLKGFAENRDKFTCGVLRWTYTMVITDMGDFPVPVGGLKYDGDCRMWWDGDKFATRSTENRMGRPSAAPAPEDQTSRREEDGTFLWIDPLESSDVYTSDLLDRKSPQRAGKNSLMGATHWRGWDSLDRRIIDERRRKGIVVEWATTDIEERTTIRRTVKDRDTGDYRIEHYDPARGYGLVRRESFTAEGRLRSSQTVRLQEIAAGAWFPVEIVTEAFRVKDASAAGENLRKTFRLEEGDSSSISRAALDLEQCSFNDRSALPDGIFEEQPRLEQRELQQILQEIQRKQTSAQAEGSTARTQEPRTVAERFLVAATRGNTEEADKWTISGRYSKVPVEWLNGYDMRVVAMIADDQEALAVTSTIRLVGSVGSIGSLTLPLTQSGKNTWLICAADLESPKGVGRKVEQFLREHPAAIMTLTSEVGTAKVVHFPADRSLGVLHTRERDFPTDSYTTSLYWRKLGEARGDVTVPAGKALRLDVDDNALRAGSPFAALQPDDIQMLDLSMCKDSDDSVLTDIARLRGLKALDLTVTTVTGDGLDHLREIPDLRWLSLASTPLNDEGAAHLASLGSLEYLNLRYTKITDAAMAHVGGLRGLKWLSLDGTAVGDEGMAMLKASTSLQSLSLWNCKITDEGLGHLDGLVNLTELDLVATQITDKG
ncbi:MAG: M56 family metallopeptidase, partial [Solirubrobacterales bacterium]